MVVGQDLAAGCQHDAGAVADDALEVDPGGDLHQARFDAGGHVTGPAGRPSPGCEVRQRRRQQHQQRGIEHTQHGPRHGGAGLVLSTPRPLGELGISLPPILPGRPAGRDAQLPDGPGLRQ